VHCRYDNARPDDPTWQATTAAARAYHAVRHIAEAIRQVQRQRAARRPLPATEPDYSAEPYRDEFRGLMTTGQVREMLHHENTHDERDRPYARLPQIALPR
jgi:hypothetical protein